MDWQFHPEGGTNSQRRLENDCPAVHLHDLLGDCQAKAGSALGPSARALDLLKLLEDTGLVRLGYAGTGVADRHAEPSVNDGGGNFHRALVGELDGVSDQISAGPA